MSIWYKDYKLSDFEWMKEDTMMDALGMNFVEIGDDFVSGTIPIDRRTIQPENTLHGGASIALAETLGSIGSYLIIDPDNYLCVGESIYANHLRPGIKGLVLGVAKPVRIGRTSHVWDVNLTNDEGKLICVCRMTNAIVRKK